MFSHKGIFNIRTVVRCANSTADCCAACYTIIDLFEYTQCTTFRNSLWMRGSVEINVMRSFAFCGSVLHHRGECPPVPELCPCQQGHRISAGVCGSQAGPGHPSASPQVSSSEKSTLSPNISMCNTIEKAPYKYPATMQSFWNAIIDWLFEYYSVSPCNIISSIITYIII